MEGRNWNRVRDQVWSQVREQVWRQVHDQVCNQVWDQVGDQVWSQVREQIRDQVWSQIEVRQFKPQGKELSVKIEKATVIRIGSLVILIILLTLLSQTISGCTQRLNEYLSWKQGIRGYPEFQFEVKGLVDAQEFYRHAWDGK